jgi:hypothetical protein
MLSRDAQVTITNARWVKEPGTPNLFWWTVQTDATDRTEFRVIGIESESEPALPENHKSFAVGRKITLRELVSVPVVSGILAYSKSERGIVLATIGRVKDQLESFCGPIAYLVPRCRTREDSVEPTSEQIGTLKNALQILMDSGIESAITYLNNSGTFDSVFEDAGGCPINPSALKNGAFEWFGRLQ